MEIKLYVGNLAKATTADDLRHLFAQAGTVIGVEVLMTPDSGQSKGFAYVTMSTQAEAQTAIALFNAYFLADHELMVKAIKTKPTTTHPPTKQFPQTRGYQGTLNAFNNHRSPNGTRRRGGDTPRH